MSLVTEIVHPHHCFCGFPDEKIQPWITKKFVEQIDTVDLLNSTTDPEEREIISIVALLDVDEETLLKIMDQVPMPKEHIIDCRQHAKDMLGV